MAPPLLVIDSLQQAIDALQQGACIEQCSSNCAKLSRPLQVAGRVMGLAASDQWYITLSPRQPQASALLSVSVFMQLYRWRYVRALTERVSLSQGVHRRFVLNDCCEIDEMSRYRHQLDCWQLG